MKYSYYKAKHLEEDIDDVDLYDANDNHIIKLTIDSLLEDGKFYKDELFEINTEDHD